MVMKVKIFEGIEKRNKDGIFTYEELESKINNFIRDKNVSGKDIVVKAVNTNQKLTLAFTIFYEEESEKAEE
jgi:hypothetical protein